MVQVVPQTREEKIAMYMKCSKKELAEMLTNRDILEDTMKAFADNQKDCDPEIMAIVNKRFMDLI